MITPYRCTPRPRSLPAEAAEPGTAGWLQHHPGPGDPTSGHPGATRATLVHGQTGRREVVSPSVPLHCGAEERLPNLVTDNKSLLLVTCEVPIGWP